MQEPAGIIFGGECGEAVKVMRGNRMSSVVTPSCNRFFHGDEMGAEVGDNNMGGFDQSSIDGEVLEHSAQGKAWWWMVG